MHAGTLAQGPVDLPELWAVQLRLAAGPPRPAEGGGATALPRGVPAADALAADLQIPCDGRQNQPAARKQTSGLLASLSHPFKVPTWRKRHALSIRQEGFNVNILSEILSLYYAKLSRSPVAARKTGRARAVGRPESCAAVGVSQTQPQFSVESGSHSGGRSGVERQRRRG
jgi:hypothetical protein